MENNPIVEAHRAAKERLLKKNERDRRIRTERFQRKEKHVVAYARRRFSKLVLAAYRKALRNYKNGRQATFTSTDVFFTDDQLLKAGLTEAFGTALLPTSPSGWRMEFVPYGTQNSFSGNKLYAMKVVNTELPD